MKITLIPEKCIACGLCYQYAKEVFDYNDDGIVKFNANDELTQVFNPDEIDLNRRLIEAAKHCPTGAILAEDISKVL